MRYSINFDHIDWRPAIEHYYWDRMEAAYAAARPLGTGVLGAYVEWLKLIEAEYVTRKHGETTQLTEWLQLEVVPDEIGQEAEELSKAVHAACEDVGHRFGYDHSASTLVSVMAMATHAPWTPGRDGFCIDKHPYEKICVPHHVTHNPQALRATLAHEYAHVLTLNLSQGKVPRWLDEAVAMIAGGDHDPQAIRSIVRGERKWLSPREIMVAYGIDRRGHDYDIATVHMAYAQSGVIGAYLVSLKGEPSLADLMKAYTNNPVWTELRIAAGLLKPTDEALREVYGLNAEELFGRAYDWLCSGSSMLPGA